MRDEDHDRLVATYSSADPDANEAEFLKALGAWSPSWRDLFRAVFRDLDTQRFGIGWWEGLDTRRRILISDQLVISLQSVTLNMREARFHVLELNEARDLATRLGAKRFVGGPRKPIPPLSVEHELAELKVTVHLGGFLRAVGSVLDCLAAVITGVAGIPRSILRADFKALLEQYFARVPPAVPDPFRQIQLRLGADLRSLIDSAGSRGWLTWALDFRNMLVHRGRHMTRNYVQANESTIVTAGGEPTFAATVTHLFPSDPGRGEVEVFRDAQQRDPMLAEDAGGTVEGISASTLAVIEGCCARLLAIWTERKANTALRAQPPEQWRDVAPSPMAGFDGYSPGSVTVRFQEVMLAGIPLTRFQAGAVLDHQRHVWQDDDPERPS